MVSMERRLVRRVNGGKMFVFVEATSATTAPAVVEAKTPLVIENMSDVLSNASVPA